MKGGLAAALRAAGWTALALCALLACMPAWAARTFTATQISPAMGTGFPMGTTQSITWQITNTAGGGNAGERIYAVRFNLASGTTFSGATAAPAGWTRSAFSATSVTFTATSWANAIASGSSASFTLSIVTLTSNQDVNDHLSSIRSYYTLTTTGPPFGQTGRTTQNPTATAWIDKSLYITSFQTTDLAGNPITALTAGSSFRLVMTVKNVSNAAQAGIVSVANPPAATKTGTVTQTLTGTTGSPLALAAGASGTITFTFSTAAADNGTIYFTAYAGSGATVTSPGAISNVLAVGRFNAAITSSASCAYPGDNVTMTMTLTNGWPYAILNVTPTLTPAAGAPVTYVSGPAPAAPIASVPPSPPTTAITWTYQLATGGSTNPFTFSGSATGTGNTVGNPVLTTPTAISASITRGLFNATIGPAVTNAGSVNLEVTVSVSNAGCAPVNSVSIAPAAGWTASTDTYSLVSVSGGGAIETWTAAGAGPIVFTAPNVAGQMPVGAGGDFAVVFTATPPAATASTFTVRVTDANGLFMDIPLGVTVNAFRSGTLNNAASKIWREDFR